MDCYSCHDLISGFYCLIQVNFIKIDAVVTFLWLIKRVYFFYGSLNVYTFFWHIKRVYFFMAH